VPSIATIDRAGRVVIPKRLRDSLRLHPNTRLRVVERDRRIVLEPIEEEPLLIRRDGLVLLGGELVQAAPAARDDRERRLDELVQRATRPRRRP
jgi:AbrB family looped-hinge helix DNA binding protein